MAMSPVIYLPNVCYCVATDDASRPEYSVQTTILYISPKFRAHSNSTPPPHLLTSVFPGSTGSTIDIPTRQPARFLGQYTSELAMDIKSLGWNFGTHVNPTQRYILREAPPAMDSRLFVTLGNSILYGEEAKINLS